MSSYTFIMAEGDILKEYREAKSPRAQIKILAEQNLVPPKVMREFIISALGDAPACFVTRRRKGCLCWTDENIEKIKEMVQKKMTDSEIAERMETSVGSVKSLRYAYGIPIGRREKRKRA